MGDNVDNVKCEKLSSWVRHPAKVENYRKAKDKNGRTVDSDYIDGAEIILSSEAVPTPTKVRYMGRPKTSGTLYNEASLPLGPFETR